MPAHGIVGASLLDRDPPTEPRVDGCAVLASISVADAAAAAQKLPWIDSRGPSVSRVSRPSRRAGSRCPARTARLVKLYGTAFGLSGEDLATAAKQYNELLASFAARPHSHDATTAALADRDAAVPCPTGLRSHRT